MILESTQKKWLEWEAKISYFRKRKKEKLPLALEMREGYGEKNENGQKEVESLDDGAKGKQSCSLLLMISLPEIYS